MPYTNESAAERRFYEARARAEVAADPCHECGGWRALYCNADGFAYCVRHYPMDML